MKKLLPLLFTLALALLLSGCGRSLAIEGSPATQDGVTVTLKKATAVKKTAPGRYEYAFKGTVANNSSEGVMKVVYTFSLRDKDGVEYRSFGNVYDGEDAALPPGAEVPFSLEGVKWGAQDVPASVVLGISSVFTETELPPVQLPEKGDFLYLALNDEKLANIKNEPPVKLLFHVDQGGYGRTATFESEDELAKAVDLFCDIRIGEETGQMVTDNYNWFSFVWADGSESYVSINLDSLEYRAHSITHIYSLDNISVFRSFASDYLVED